MYYSTEIYTGFSVENVAMISNSIFWRTFGLNFSSTLTKWNKYIRRKLHIKYFNIMFRHQTLSFKEVEIKEMLEYVQVLTIYVTVLRHFFWITLVLSITNMSRVWGVSFANVGFSTRVLFSTFPNISIKLKHLNMD